MCNVSCTQSPCISGTQQGSHRPQCGQHHHNAEGLACQGAEGLPLGGMETSGATQVGIVLRFHPKYWSSSLCSSYSLYTLHSFMYYCEGICYFFVELFKMSMGRSSGPPCATPMWWNFGKRRLSPPGKCGLTTSWYFTATTPLDGCMDKNCFFLSLCFSL